MLHLQWKVFIINEMLTNVHVHVQTIKIGLIGFRVTVV